MRIYQKLTLSFLGISCLLAGLGGISLNINSGIKKDNDRVSENSIIEIGNAKKITRSILLVHVASQEFLLDRYQPEDLNIPERTQQDEIDLAKNTIEEQLDIFEKTLDSGMKSGEAFIAKNGNVIYDETLDEEQELEILIQLKKEFYEYKKLMEEYMHLAETNPENAYDFLEEKIEPKIRKDILPLVRQYQDDAIKELQYDTKNIQNSIYKDNIFIGFSTIFSLLVSISLGLIISRQISRPIKQLTESASQVGKGKLEPIKIERFQKQNELVILAQTFNQMIEGLKQTTVSISYLDDILSSMTDSLVVANLDGKIKKVNQATLKLLGYSESELIDKSIGLILGKKSISVDSKSRNCPVGSCETIYKTKEGKKIPVAFSSSYILNDEGQPHGVVCVARDITQKYLTEKALRESEERYALASRAANDGLWDWNLNNNRVYYSPRWKSLLGYEEDEIKDTPEEWFNRVHPDYIDRLKEEIATHVKHNISHFEISYPIEYRDGSYRWMLCRGIAIADEQGKVYRITGSQTDITLSRLVEEQLRFEALHDTLTNLPNRTFFLEELERVLVTSEQNGDYKFSVLFLDLDRFKVINDSLGHLVGDLLLVEFAHRVKNCLGEEQIFARLGGDEFVIILENIQDISNATKLADSIQEKLRKPFNLERHEIFVTVSIGIAQSTENYQQIEDILRDADIAMYQAKASGKARYALFEPGMHQEVVTTLQIENDLRRAIEREEFQLFYQPIVRVSNGQIVGFEALLRWLHPEKGMISPGDFIPLAEETGAIVEMGWWILEKACHQMYLWQQRYPNYPPMMMSVNVSVKQFDEIHNISDRIQEILHKTGLNPSSLKLEITESIIMNNPEKLTVTLDKLKALGIKLSMDDFGTGYSSLSYLYKLPIDTLKIDRSFIKNIDIDSEKLELTQTIINLAKNLNMETIAEGIETSKQLTKLKTLNCKYGQGYLFSKPVNSEIAEALISNQQQVVKWVS